MGWKNLKEHFGIGHIVQVRKKGICIGTESESELIVIKFNTGIVERHMIGSGQFLRENYQSLLNAQPSEILELINSTDSFEHSISVYTFKEGEIVEKQCEIYGFPNVTHDGILMYENAFFKSKQEAIEKAIDSTLLGIKTIKRNVAEIETALVDENLLLDAEIENLEKLKAMLQQCNA